MRIAFLIPTLSSGGAERVATMLCSEWCRQGHDIHLITYAEKGDPAYELAPGIHWHKLAPLLKSAGFLLRSLGRILAIRRCLGGIEPDVLVCFLTEANVTSIAAATGFRFPVVVSERVHPGFHAISAVHAFLRRLTYPRAKALIVQTETIAAWCRQHLRAEVVVIPNPVRQSATPEIRESDGLRRRVIVAMGRLEHQKGFDLLIEAFAPLASQYPDWQVEVLGEGSARSVLDKQIRAAGMADRITLMGLVTDGESRLRSAEIYCHPARYEGFPNALAEALASGCCVIASDAPGAMAELLADGTYGLLAKANDAADLRRQLAAAMASEETRRHFQAVAARAVDAFDVVAIAARWIRVFRNG
jgi:GalNAc-alpha-(1->4)-GalNAc-alpha-(1->3)-diNAcBac-PP-undecaprenol alpha-1,4-N-acetyl-D-galactosaminyltransferase